MRRGRIFGLAGRAESCGAGRENDVDVLLIYDEDADIEELEPGHEQHCVRSEGKTVLAERGIPDKADIWRNSEIPGRRMFGETGGN